MSDFIGEKLRAMCADKPLRKIQRLRKILADIEAAKKNGVSHAALVAMLAEHNISLSVKSLSRMLMSLRRETNADAPHTRSLPIKKSTVPEARPEEQKSPPAQAQPLSPRQERVQTADKYINLTPINPILKNMEN